jgi:hypothetical protein
MNEPGATNCKRCNTMIRIPGGIASGGKKAMMQIALLVTGMVAAVILLWLLMHDVLHLV